MNNLTIQRLNQLNQTFYQITAVDFNESRAEPWTGWLPLLPYLKSPLSVLDVGCGNGRFGAFLVEHLSGELTYHGIDSSPELLQRAQAAVPNGHFEQRDIIQQPLASGEYDLVVLFGVLHHIPSVQQRQELMRNLAQQVKLGGFLAFAAWRFYEYPRFRERFLPWPDDLDQEPHDYLLDWRRGAQAVRYCHYVDDAEHVALAAVTGLCELLSYRADGRTHDINRYSLLQRENA